MQPVSLLPILLGIAHCEEGEGEDQIPQHGVLFQTRVITNIEQERSAHSLFHNLIINLYY